MHANRAKEIADKFDVVAYQSAHLEKEKSTVIERILEVASNGGYFAVYCVENDCVVDGLHKYLNMDCGYGVTRGTDDFGTYLEISWG